MQTPSPSTAAGRPSIALSTITIRTKRARPDPSDIRSAISRVRAAACPAIRFATLAHAISSTSATSTPSTVNADPYSFCMLEAPVPAGFSDSVAVVNKDNRYLGVLFRRSFSHCWYVAFSLSASAFTCTPGRTRTNTHIGKLFWFSRLGSIFVGAKMSVTVPGSVPVNPFGPTPAISYRLSRMRNVRPITFGSRPNRRCQ
jgi:hypothetical protein